MKIVILGAGITGLAAGYKTRGTIYEAEGSPGGICRSYYDNGYRFEKGGGHWIFGADLEVMDFLMQFASFIPYKRNAGVYINKTFPYPIQKYFDIEEAVDVGTMQSWLRDRFGSAMCRLFFYPFNEKYTAGLYDKIAPQDAFKNPTRGEGYNDTFLYPELGLDSMIDTIARGIDIRYHKKAVSINPDEKMIYFDDGDSRRYEQLISTLPLNTMARLLNVKDKLPYTSTVVLNIGATPGRNFPREHWLYIPYCKSGFHRVGFYSNVHRSFAPPNRVGLYVEWAYTKNVPDFSYTFQELTDWGFIKKVERSSFNLTEVAYTWEHPNSNEAESLLSMISDCRIRQIGRYGQWHFQGIAESIREGLEC